MEFYESSPNKCKACVLQRQKELKAARTGGKVKANKGGGGTTRKTRAKAAPTPRAPDSLYTRPGGMGFTVQLEVDENTKTTDIRLTQYNAVAEADQNIWLNQLEARELLSWLADHLGKP